MLHRTAGDASALALESFEADFTVAREWVTAEPRNEDSFTRHGRTRVDMLIPQSLFASRLRRESWGRSPGYCALAAIFSAAQPKSYTKCL